MDAATLFIDGHIATINLNRPKALNSYDLSMAQSLLAHTETLLLNDQVRVVLVRGEGNAFMAGGDIEFFARELSSMPKGIRSIIRTLANTINNMRQAKQIYLAAVHGAVAGAGMSLMLGCDLVLAEENTVFTTAYNKLATSPDGALSYFLPKLVGDKKAMELLLLSDRLTAVEMQRLGLINTLTHRDNFEAQVDSLLQRLAQLPVVSSNHIKQLVYQSHQHSFETHCEAEAKAFIDSVQRSDFSEGVHAFLERRAPEFSS